MAEPASLRAEEWVVFGHTFGALLERLDPLPPEARATLRTDGIDVDRPLLPAYPYPVWVRFTQVLAGVLFPARDAATAHRELGLLFIKSYAQTRMGLAVMTLLKVIGPRRALGRTAKAFRSGNNYFESRLDELGPSDFHLWINETGTHPQLIAGMLAAALQHCGVPDPQVNPEPAPAAGRSFRITWR
jgi:uncharacterized protein (TIGR02265 family)